MDIVLYGPTPVVKRLSSNLFEITFIKDNYEDKIVVELDAWQLLYIAERAISVVSPMLSLIRTTKRDSNLP
jgi:hypothetical protein